MDPVLALFRRNAWATEQLLGFCAAQPPEVLQRADPDVYGSIEATFNHIVSAEQRYLSRLDGAEPTLRDRGPLSVAELGGPARDCAARWEALLAAPLQPEREREHQGQGGERFRLADWHGFVQVVHHGDDHRTQVNTLLSRQGVEPPNLDGWAFGDLAHASSEISEGARQLLPYFVGHHLWATSRLMSWAVRLEDEQAQLTAPGTYGTLEKTLEHLVFSDHTYLGWLEQQDWRTCLSAGMDWEAQIGDDRGRSPAWAVALQAIHHGNDHRTHAGTVALANDLKAPDLDVWSYAAAEGGYSEL
ncbi:MAG TPA: DinB family protein [Candidatus Dormibacteraeota bacterium]